MVAGGPPLDPLRSVAHDRSLAAAAPVAVVLSSADPESAIPRRFQIPGLADSWMISLSWPGAGGIRNGSHREEGMPPATHETPPLPTYLDRQGVMVRKRQPCGILNLGVAG